MIALSPHEQYEYVLKAERDIADPTVFILKPLTMQQTREIEDEIGMSLTGTGFKAGTVNYLALKYGLRGWKNLKYRDGTDVPFVTNPDGTASDETIEKLDAVTRSELAGEIWTSSHLTEDDRKNSK